MSTAPALSPAEAARVAAFDAAPTPPEVVVENVARAIDTSIDSHQFNDWEWQQALDSGEISRIRAVAAVAAYQAAQDGGAEEAVRRVEALCDVADDQPDGYECRFIAVDLIRAALAGENR